MESLQYAPYQMATFQFLSVCHYITNFGKIFYNLNLIRPEYQNSSGSVLNTLFKYIHDSKNKSEAKLQLIRKVLMGSDLYGGGENETLDMKYVDETFQYIISSALFSHYGYIHGYLAEIISRTDNINYWALKENVFYQLSQNYTTYDYCSSSQVNDYRLTNLTIVKVFKEHVWSMFPEPEHNMKILDINYIYAMIGLKIIRSIPGDTKKLSFKNYILLAKLNDFQIKNNETFQVAMELYSTPALFYYAYNEKDKFVLRRIYDGNENFLQTVIFTFIDFLDSCHGSIFTNVFIKSQFTKWNTIVIQFEYNIKDMFRNKFSNKNLDILYQLELNSIQQLLIDGNIVEKMKVNATLKLLFIFHQSIGCRECIPGTGGKYGEIFIVFSIIKNGKIDLYTIRQDSNTLTLLSNISEEQILASTAWNDVYSGENYPNYSTDLQQSHHNYKIFLKVIAKILSITAAKIFLTSENITSKGETLEMAKSFPPYYTCFEGITYDNNTEIAPICKPVFKSLLSIPEVGENILSTVWRSKSTETGQQMLRNISKSEINYLRISDDLGKIYLQMLDKYFIFFGRRNLTIDYRIIFKPGFELSLQTSNYFIKMLGGITQALDLRFSSYPNVKNLLSMKSAIHLLNKYAALNHNQTGQIFRYRYPGGSNYFGPLCISSFGRVAEFRTVDRIQYKVPVILNPLPMTDLQSCVFGSDSNCLDQATELSLSIHKDHLTRQRFNLYQSNNNNYYYNLYNPKTGEIYEIVFKVQKNTILQLLGLYSDEDFLKIIDLSTAYAN